MRIDEDRAQAFDAEAFDEAHAAHVGSEVIHFNSTFADAMAICFDTDVETKIFHARHMEIPLIERFLIHSADVGEAFFREVQREVAADEAAGAGDDNQVIFSERSVFFDYLFFHNGNQNLSFFVCCVMSY